MSPPPQVQAALQVGQPVISVDAKKKELVGDFKNAGREWRPECQPGPVRVYDFIIPDLGRDTPDGIDDTGLEIAVCHFPPGTSKWNKIEHWLFSFISQNWLGKPLVSHETIVNLIAATTTKTGLKTLLAQRHQQPGIIIASADDP